MLLLSGQKLEFSKGKGQNIDMYDLQVEIPSLKLAIYETYLFYYNKLYKFLPLIR
jgi:hypothetical protein